jgi:hypothetical protein
MSATLEIVRSSCRRGGATPKRSSDPYGSDDHRNPPTARELAGGGRRRRASARYIGHRRDMEQGEIDGIEAFDQLLIEELTVRENRRVRTALTLARLTTIKITRRLRSCLPALARQISAFWRWPS